MFALTDLGKADNLVDALFGLDLEEEFKCEESGESKISTATAKKLVCNIQGGAGSNTQASRPVFVGGALCVPQSVSPEIPVAAECAN